MSDTSASTAIIDVNDSIDSDLVETLQRKLDAAEKDLAEAKKLIEQQGKRINQDVAMKLAIAKLLS